MHLCRLVTGGAAAESLLGCWAQRTFVRNTVQFSSFQVSEIILPMPSSDQWHATKVFGPASDWCRRCNPVSCLENRDRAKVMVEWPPYDAPASSPRLESPPLHRLVGEGSQAAL